MSVNPQKPTKLLGSVATAPDWARRRDIALALIGWFVIVAVALWAASHIIGALLTAVVGALLAYAIYPLVTLLSRWMPRALAILVTYVCVLGALGFVGYLVIDTAVVQVTSLVHQITTLLTPGQASSPSALMQTLRRFGISASQIQSIGQQINSHVPDVATGAVPVVVGIFGGVLDTILVIVLSVYLQVDGHRLVLWLRERSPIRVRGRMNFLVHTFERVVGGYIRGQIALAALVGVLVGLGMTVLQVPYAVLLGLLAFILEFIPIIGVFISGAACVLLALTHGVLLALIVLAYFVFVHIIEGDVVGPRIVGRAVGLHPAVSIFALLAGAELFGLWGALFASPVAGVIQAVLLEVWREWRETHPNQFPEQFGAAVVPVTTREATSYEPQPDPAWHVTSDASLLDRGATTAIPEQRDLPHR